MRAKDPAWYSRFAVIPGVTYDAPAEVDVSRLRRRNERPEVSRFAGLPASLWWGTEDESSSESPASAHSLTNPSKASTTRVLRNIAEALELPGEPADYHFAIQTAVTLLRSRRQEGPNIFAELERLCRLDLQLIEACPDAVSLEREGQTQYYRIESFNQLMTLYLNEGALDDAARVLCIAERFGQGDVPAGEKLRSRLAAVAAEDASR